MSVMPGSRADARTSGKGQTSQTDDAAEAPPVFADQQTGRSGDRAQAPALVSYPVAWRHAAASGMRSRLGCACPSAWACWATLRGPITISLLNAVSHCPVRHRGGKYYL